MVVTVKGGYSPDVISVRQGVPLEIVLDRQESGDCTSRVVFPDLAVSAALPAFGRTTVRLDPAQAGLFGFACGMNMIHGTLVAEPSGLPAASEGRSRPHARRPWCRELAMARGSQPVVLPRRMRRRHRRRSGGRRSPT
ncbi:MAG TPA: cupredoxin domain-containing protein [Streptosporangiaceae bacterium]|nr:cupredoxin domain-containing protein [Streptosporangiaceae bacterium]